MTGPRLLIPPRPSAQGSAPSLDTLWLPGLAPAGPPRTPPAGTPPSPGSPTFCLGPGPPFSPPRLGPSGLAARGLLFVDLTESGLPDGQFPCECHRLFSLARWVPVGCTFVTSMRYRCLLILLFPNILSVCQTHCHLLPGKAHRVILEASSLQYAHVHLGFRSHTFCPGLCALVKVLLSVSLSVFFIPSFLPSSKSQILLALEDYI